MPTKKGENLHKKGNFLSALAPLVRGFLNPPHLYAFLIKRSGTSNMLNMRFMLFIKITQSVHDCDEWMAKERKEIVRGGRFEGFGMVANLRWIEEKNGIVRRGKGNMIDWGGTDAGERNLGTRVTVEVEGPLPSQFWTSGLLRGLLRGLHPPPTPHPSPSPAPSPLTLPSPLSQV